MKEEEYERLGEYEYLKGMFKDRIGEFIRTQSKYSPEKIIEKLKLLINEYEKYYNEGKEDEELIDMLKQNMGWYSNITKSKKILKKDVDVKEKEKIRKDVTTLQFKYQTSMWRKLFNQRSFNNELFGQALLHITIGIITDIKVPIKNNQFLNARPSLFYIQRSRSGKNQGMYFVEDILKKFKKKRIKNSRPIIILRMGKQTDPTLLNSFVLTNKKGGMEVKKDKDGKCVIIRGELEKSDLVWQPEANYLLNPVGQHNEESISIFLNLLEPEGTYTKKLQGWGGLSTVTNGGNFALVGLTRPIENVKKHIAYNGLLQRCIFMPRKLSRQERREMLSLVALHSHKTAKQKEEYERNFDKLIKELEEMQNFAFKNPPNIKDEESELFVSELNKKLMHFDKIIQKECSVESNKDIFEDFLAGYSDILYMISFQSAIVRRSKWVELVDLEYAFNFLDNVFNMLMPWIEESIEMTQSEIKKMDAKRNCMYKAKKLLKDNKIKDIIKFIQNDLKVSYPTAKTILQDFAEEGPFKMVEVDWRQKIVVFL